MEYLLCVIPILILQLLYVVISGSSNNFRVSILFSLTSLLYISIFYGETNPSIGILVLFLALQFFSVGFLFGNVRSLAMQPLGHIAGIGAAINGFVSTIMAVPIATFIGGFVETTALPLFIGFAACGFGSLLLLLFVKKSA